MSEDTPQAPWHEVRKIATDVNKDTSPQILLFKAIDRKAFAAATGNLEGWESSINEVIAQLPSRVRHAIEDRCGEYLSDASHWEPRVICGITFSGDPHAPLLSNKRDDVDYDPHLRAETYEVEFEPETGKTLSVKDKWEIGGPQWVSPKWIIETEKTNYPPLNTVLHTEMELGGLTWKHDKRDLILPGTDFTRPKAKKPQSSPMY